MIAKNQWAFVAVSPKAQGYTTESGIYIPTTPDELYVHGIVVEASGTFPAEKDDVIVFTSTPRPIIEINDKEYFLVQDKEVIAILDEDEAKLHKSNLVSLAEVQDEIANGELAHAGN